MKSIFLITNAPTPYRLPLFGEISRQLAEIGYHFKVLFSVAGYARRQWSIDWNSAKFEYQIMNGRAINLGSHENYLFTHPGLIRMIRRERPELVICGGFSVTTILLRLAARWTGTPFLIWSEENKRRSAFRQISRRLLISGAEGLIASGFESRRYLENLGARSDRIWTAINTVDTELFARQYARRLERSCPVSKHVLLCISALVPQKRLDTVLHAAAVMAQRRSDFEVVILGSGPERERLENVALALGITEIVKFKGHLQQAQVADELLHASCFLFPSTYDVWGMVLVEAMAAGVPCISSIKAGATADLIKDGVTGYAVDFADTKIVCDRVERLLDDCNLARDMGGAAHDLVETQATIRVSAQGVTNAVKCLRDLGKIRPTTR